MPNKQRERQSSSDVQRRKAAFRDVVPGVVLLVILQGSLIALDPEGSASGWEIVWALSPLIPFAWLVWAQVRSLRRADEYQRTVQLEAMSIGFGGFLLLALMGGLLDAAGIGDPAQWLQITFIGGIVVWVAALGIQAERDR